MDGWVEGFSKTHQRKFYSNAQLKLSLFHDDTLPAGWAMGRCVCP
jgi:hypothetical protein